MRFSVFNLWSIKYFIPSNFFQLKIKLIKINHLSTKYVFRGRLGVTAFDRFKIKNNEKNNNLYSFVLIWLLIVFKCVKVLNSYNLY